MEKQSILSKGKFLVLILSMIFLLSFVSADSDIFKIVSKVGSQDGGVQVNCPSGYTVTGGGFADRSSIEDDQDASYPNGNGWYCQEDYSDAFSQCYAVCWDSDIVSTNILSDNSKQSHGLLVECADDEFILGGGFGIEWKNDNDQDESYPKDNGWMCKDTESYTGDEGTQCYAVCGEAENDYEMTCETKEIKGNLEDGVSVYCDEGTYLTSGGYRDRAGNHDDQDNNYPINNGWYCQEDRSSGDSVCYARCCSAEYTCEVDMDKEYGEWQDVGECDDWLLKQVRTVTEYDANDCKDSEDFVYIEEQYVDCVMPCIDNDNDGYGLNCDAGSDCDDNDVNINPGADEVCGDGLDNDCDGETDEYCEVTPECYTDIECGIPHCAGDPNYCSDGDVYQYFEVPKCINAGESDAYCSYDLILPWLIQDCYWGCAWGVCLGEPDNDEDDDGYNKTVDCNDNNYYINPGMVENCSTDYDDNCDGNINEGCNIPCVEDIVNGTWSDWTNSSECANGTLSQMRTMVEYDANVCGTFVNVTYTEIQEINCSSNETEECCVDENCTADYYGDRYCKGDDVYKKFYNFTCVNGSCIQEVTELFIKECSEDCDDGACVSDDDDDDNSWNDVSYFTMQNSGATNKSAMNAIQLGDDEADKTDYTSLWWLIAIFVLILLILAVAVMIIRTMF